MPVITLQLDKGWLPDFPPFEIPEGGLTDTDLIYPSMLGYRGIDAEATGTNTLVTATDGAYGAREFADAGKTIYWGSQYSLHKVVDMVASDIASVSRSNYAALEAIAQWQFEKYGDWILATNGTDPVQIMKETTFDDLGGAPPAAKYMLLYGGRLILGELSLALSRGTTDTNVASSWFRFKIAGEYYSKNSVAAGTALAVGTIPQDKWGIYRFTIQTDGTITSTAAAANFTTGYTTEAVAIAALPAVPGGEEEMGYVTVQTKTGQTFVGGTDGLFGGSSGNVANATNYYIDTGIRSNKTIYWSALEDIEDWEISTTTGCDRQPMPELNGDITGLQKTSGGFAIFSRYSIRTGWLSRGVDVFNFAQAVEDLGAAAYSTISANGGVYYWSDRDIHFFNGQYSQPIGEGVRLTVLGGVGYPTSTIPGTYRLPGDDTNSIVSVAHDPDEKLIVWNYTYGGDTPPDSLTFIFSYKLNQFTKYKRYDYSVDTKAIDTIVYSYGHRCFVVLCPQSGTSTIFAYRINAAGTGGDLTTGEVSIRDESGNILTVMIKGVRPRIHGYTAAVAVTVSSRMNEDDTPADVSATIALTSFSGKADLRALGRYHKIKTTLAGGICKTMDVEYERAGKQ